MSVFKTLTKTLLAASMVSAVFYQAQAADFTLRATATSNENDEDYDGLVVFKDYVESASNGAIEVELYIGTQLCVKGEECLQGLIDGSIDIFVGTGSSASIFPYAQVLDLPYLMSDDRVAEMALSGDFTRKMREMALADSGDKIRLMAIGNTGGWRNFANTVRPVRTPDDLADLKIRTIPAALPQELTRVLGASPTPIAWPELFTSLQTGVVEGTKNGITDIMNMKFPEAGLQYLTLDGHAYMGAFWFMSNDKFMSMPEDMRRVVVDGFYALQQATFASPKRKAIQAYQDFKAGGGEIYVPTPSEKAAFREAAAPVYQWFADNVDGGQEILDALNEAVAEAEAVLASEYSAELK
ncbi:MAG: TRAP transporter substrate-binding protein DctP [Alphaproteobacteria bacterium]